MRRDYHLGQLRTPICGPMVPLPYRNGSTWNIATDPEIQLLRIPKIESCPGSDQLFKLQRPWRTVRSVNHPDRFMVMERRNYKAYADIGLRPGLRHPKLVSLDTGAGPKFVRSSELPQEEINFISYGPLPDSCDANYNTLGTTIRLGRYI